MEWIIQPFNGFNEMSIIAVDDCTRAFSTTNCLVYASCSGTGQLIVQV